MTYNWQQPDWPEFRYNLATIEDLLFGFAEEMGHVSGVIKSLSPDIQTEAMIDLMATEAIKTSEIEDEHFSRQDVVSSIRNKLGTNKAVETVTNKMAQGAGELMVAVRETYADALTEETLFTWHRLLMKGNRNINAGCWRTHKDAMQVISGAIGKEKIHFEAPPSARVPIEMKRFIKWFNATGPGGSNELKKAPLRSAIAHLYFETIHPFEDGNGRIGRAIAEKALSQTTNRPVFLSLSRTIEADKKSYYGALKHAQQSNEITPWIEYFVTATLKAQRQAKTFIEFILKKSSFVNRLKHPLNDRQLKMVEKMLAAGPDGFEGGMSAKKYMSITSTSKATATRDLQYLLEKNILVIGGGGRSIHYMLNL